MSSGSFWSLSFLIGLSVYRTISKPFFDLIFTLIIIIVLSPLMLLLFIIQFFLNQGGVFFHQSRIGLNGVGFDLIKFKSMIDQVGSEINPANDGKRLTVFGRFLRSTSLDELPQLLNVLKGDMSLVGPRPLLPEYMGLYNEHQHKRHLVKPGITGWAQVNGRNNLSWQTKLDLDVWYVQHQGFWLDLKILFLTVWKVLTAQGITASNTNSAEKFNGKN